MNVNTNGFPQSQGGQQQFLNPAMLQSLQNQSQNAQFQKNSNNPALMNPQMFQQQGLAMNPQQLLNGRGASAMSQQMQLNQSLNPALLLQMQGGNSNMQAGLAGGMGQGSLGMGGMGNMGNTAMATMGGVNANAMGFTPQHLAQLQQMTPQQQMQAQAKLMVWNFASYLSIFKTYFIATTRVATAETIGADEPRSTSV